MRARFIGPLHRRDIEGKFWQLRALLGGHNRYWSDERVRKVAANQVRMELTRMDERGVS